MDQLIGCSFSDELHQVLSFDWMLLFILIFLQTFNMRKSKHCHVSNFDTIISISMTTINLNEI